MNGKRLSNKAALVTGSSRGIGRGIAFGFAREGADVVVHYRTRKDSAEEVVAAIREIGGNAVALGADLGDAESVKSLIGRAWDAFGRIDVLVNNAGVVYDVEFLGMPLETWRKTLSVNLDGAMLCSQLTARRMVETRIKGSIICVTSVNGFQVEKNRLAYNVSKGGLEILVKSMAAELGPHGIRVNGISPGLVKTDMVPEDFWEGDWSLFRAKTPLGRHGVVEDIAGPAVFLASDQSGYVNGHIIVVDGGMTITQI